MSTALTLTRAFMDELELRTFGVDEIGVFNCVLRVLVARRAPAPAPDAQGKGVSNGFVKTAADVRAELESERSKWMLQAEFCKYCTQRKEVSDWLNEH